MQDLFKNNHLLFLQVQLGIMDKWNLSYLATAVSACNAGFQQYDFPRATSAIYNFFLYELCDVYLVISGLYNYLLL